ncbi:putative monooxygenase [Microdochium trichocladiopsis]|uniref:Monooxygenase n=1 Tax=Microdochium trichocladiopsis TaxID=1682393 RepID=A0A9P8XT15_9PEZI|nr:putative monooxygenase [Microdochium trichocladiopsis]KAH7012763.1 putative monooxygenase [Microdochium trichocladiopsis]
MEAQQNPPFRVVIAGAGLVGLTAAHILTKAGIDFVILEKHKTVVPAVGSVMTIWPQTFRIFEQLGLNDILNPLLETLNTNTVISADDASELDVSRFPDLIERNHGWAVRVLVRTKFIEALYDSLPQEAKAKVLLGRHVEDVEMDDTGVKITCRGGFVERGDMLIGADGVRSQTRLHMESLRQNKAPSDLADKYQKPYLSTYRVLVAQVDTLPDVPTNIKYDGVRYGVTTQFIYGKQVSCMAVYEKLETPTSDHHRYTDQDKTDMLRRWGHLMVLPGYSVRDLHEKSKTNIGLYDCEEGLVERWHHGRIVLVGDAVRKLDPHTGQGYNEGVTDLVVLLNNVRKMLLASSQGVESAPSTARLEAVFAKYEADRMKQMGAVLEISKAFARMAAWLSWKDMVMAKYVQPYLPLNYLSMTYILGPMIAGSPVLEWLEERWLPPGKMAWRHHPKLVEPPPGKEPSKGATSAM